MIPIPPKSELRALKDNVYTDGTYVYKDVMSGSEAKLIERVQDIPNTQQLVEYNHEKRVLITKFIEGFHIHKGSRHKLGGSTPYAFEQFEQLFDTLIRMKERNVTFEAHYRNIIYNPKEGFFPIDYHTSYQTTIPFFQLAKIIGFSQREYINNLWQASAKIPKRFKDVPERLLHALAKVNTQEARDSANWQLHNILSDEKADEIISLYE